ncbi:hypothetical protein Hanom_Chr15g01391901 [Helianthus anomalus]
MLLLKLLMWSKSLSLQSLITQVGRRKRGVHPLTQLLIGHVEKNDFKQKGTVASRKATLAE